MYSQKIPEGPEMDEYKEKRKAYDQDFPNVLATISGGSSIEVTQLDIEENKIEDLMEEATATIERTSTADVFMSYFIYDN